MDNAFRVIHFKDFVPHQPKMGFADYYHHKTEVFYQDPMGPTAYTVCKSKTIILKVLARRNFQKMKIISAVTDFSHQFQPKNIWITWDAMWPHSVKMNVADGNIINNVLF